MKELFLLLPARLLPDPGKDPPLVPLVLAAYQALWHPALLAQAQGVPSLRDVNDLPPAAETVLACPEPVLQSAGRVIQQDLASSQSSVLVAKAEHAGIDGPGRLAASLGLAADLPHLLDFFALGYAHLGLDVLFRAMGQENPTDTWSFWSEVRRAAEESLAGRDQATRDGLQAAYDVLMGARQTVYPATIHWLDLVLVPPSPALPDLERRLGWGCPFNLLLSGWGVEELAARHPQFLETLRTALAQGKLEVVGGTYDERPLWMLPFESRAWELERAARAYETHLRREVECFASHRLALAPDLPQLLMKFGYRSALHTAFDASRFPHFREAKLHWTTSEGSVIEALARDARNASQDEGAFDVFTTLARSLTDDRTATIVLAHWLDRAAPWLEWLLRINAYGGVLGTFESVGDYFLGSSTPDHPTRTRLEEYSSGHLSLCVRRQERDPISRWVDHQQVRGRFDAASALCALDSIASGATATETQAIEDAVERSEPGAIEQVRSLEAAASRRLADRLLEGAPGQQGYLVLNSCSFPRRACLELRGVSADLPLEPPLREIQGTPDGAAVILDVPGWGYAWIPREGSGTPVRRPRSAPLAKGRRLHNEYVEVEIDKRTGGLRGIWELRSAYSRLGQQLVHRAGSVTRCRRIDVTATGPAFGEIITQGEVRSKDGKAVLAEFTQRFRLWAGRPHLELRIELEPRQPITGDAFEDAIVCQWAWPDEKAQILPASGFPLQLHQAPDWETGQFVEIRERKLLTDIVLHGLSFHQRIGYRMADTFLIVAGETRRQFELSVALDLAHPWMAVYDTAWPLAVVPVDRGPPLMGRTGWLARVEPAAILATRLAPLGQAEPAVRMHLVETAGKQTRGELRFCRNPRSARLTNFRGQLVYDLHPASDKISLDLGAHEILRIEVTLPPGERPSSAG